MSFIQENSPYFLLGVFMLILIYAPQGFAFYIFLKKFLILNRSKKSFVGCLILVYMVKSLTAASLPPVVSVVLHFLVYSLITTVYFRGSVLQKLFFSSFYTVFTVVIEMLVWYGVQYIPLDPERMDNANFLWLSFSFIVVILLSIMLCLLLLRLFQVDSTTLLSNQDWAVLNLVSAGSLLIIIVNIRGNGFKPSNIPLEFVIILLGILVINIAVMFMYHKLMRRMQVEFHNHVLEQQVTEYTGKLKENQEAKRLRHDLNHVLLFIHSLLEAGAVQEARAYVAEVALKHRPGERFISSGNIAIDAIYNEKFAIAELNKVAMQSHFRIPQDLSLAGKEVNIAIILGNALDNAIEGVQRLPQPGPYSIELEVIFSDGLLVISLKNPASLLTEDGHGSFLSSKRNLGSKGFGIESIEYAVQQLQGSVTFRYEDQQFMMLAVLPVHG
ncbi:ATP-binding protein [Paenibacillus sp. FSL M7-1046]|uniref:ATP-binding protein n=1 Tax=Paenibacillus sp. FSL M7-1046 TaxID=2975315 RepID=UPI0030F83CFB